MKEVYVQSNKHRHHLRDALWPPYRYAIVLDTHPGRMEKEGQELSLNPSQHFTVSITLRKLLFSHIFICNSGFLVHTL